MFSIIIPTYNRKFFLNKAIQSVVDQTHSDWELIIVDDGSTDGTKAFIDGVVQKSPLLKTRVKYVWQENQGVSHARNQGIALSKGEWLAFLDSDDWWLPRKLEIFHATMQCYSDIKIFHSEEIWYRGGKKLEPLEKHRKPDGWVYQNILPICCMSLSTLVIHRSVFDDVGLFDEELLACEDYDFFLRTTCKYPVKLILTALTEKEGGRVDQLSSLRGLDRYRILSLHKMLISGVLSDEKKQETLKEIEKKALIYCKGARKNGNGKGAIFVESLLRSTIRHYKYQDA